ncbi:hypothetical protein CEXT_626271 [Caerostris extrusa]|uniref:Uncharacterized protein n=1 Tax=Caerostris extrusa TaxID=172846 RepID=A0AAV4U7L5_CAEEX|nr:hypothetical protein CEXT_626271 [Caerostris extrusa]
MKGEDKDTGILAKLKAEPLALFLGLVLPLTLIFAAVLAIHLQLLHEWKHGSSPHLPQLLQATMVITDREAKTQGR